MLDGLKAAGLVIRQRCLQHRRTVTTSLTERGHALVEERHARFAHPATDRRSYSSARRRRSSA
jgi:DNA-binding MarR family transcriptional regulator